jgi:hypothetical protein
VVFKVNNGQICVIKGLRSNGKFDSLFLSKGGLYKDTLDEIYAFKVLNSDSVMTVSLKGALKVYFCTKLGVLSSQNPQKSYKWS